MSMWTLVVRLATLLTRRYLRLPGGLGLIPCGNNPLDARKALVSIEDNVAKDRPMLKLLLLLFILVSACVAIHGLGMILGLRWLGRTSPRHGHHFSLSEMFWILVRVVYGLLLLHLMQIVVWAACYHWNGCFPDFATAFYYSATSYSTAGYGDVNPPENWRILGAIEAVTGILMFGWSTGVLFSVVNHLVSRFKYASPPGGGAPSHLS